MLVASLSFSSTSQAGVISAQLTGDVRATNPNGLIVDVTIKFGADSSTGLAADADWTFDINSLLHPNVKLDEFYFNLNVVSSNVAFSGFSPTGWDVNSSASVQGAGGTTFSFEALDPQGRPKANDVTNLVNLSFTASLTSEIWTDAMFTGASTAVSNDSGSGQLGAHLQSLVAGSGQTNSGFAFGYYVPQGPSSGPGASTPEPGTVAIWSLIGMVGLGNAVRRRRRR
jgi:hypothetical protein